MQGEMTYFKDPHDKMIKSSARQAIEVENDAARHSLRQSRVLSKRGATSGSGEDHRELRNTNESLVLTVEALKAQLEDQTKLAKEQVPSTSVALKFLLLVVLDCCTS